MKAAAPGLSKKLGIPQACLRASRCAIAARSTRRHVALPGAPKRTGPGGAFSQVGRLRRRQFQGLRGGAPAASGLEIGRRSRRSWRSGWCRTGGRGKDSARPPPCFGMFDRRWGLRRWIDRAVYSSWHADGHGMARGAAKPPPRQEFYSGICQLKMPAPRDRPRSAQRCAQHVRQITTGRRRPRGNMAERNRRLPVRFLRALQMACRRTRPRQHAIDRLSQRHRS